MADNTKKDEVTRHSSVLVEIYNIIQEAVLQNINSESDQETK